MKKENELNQNDSNSIRNIEKKIISIIDEIRPYLNMDGGDISYVKYENGCLYVKMLGACAHCMAQDNTLNDGLLCMIQEEIPEVKEIINVLL